MKQNFVFGFFLCVLQVAKLQPQNDVSISTEVGENIENRLKTLELAFEDQNLRYEHLNNKFDELQAQFNSSLDATKTTVDGEGEAPKFYSCDHALSEPAAKDGVYQITLLTFNPLTIKALPVYCMRHPQTKEAWTVIQRRMNGKIDFYRNWCEYVRGFGELTAEHWLGLEKIHALTSSRPQKLWIELGNFENENRSAYYENFAIGNADAGYHLLTLGAYSGDAGDSLSYSLGKKFSTKDNENNDYNCAKRKKGAWWLDNSSLSDLNGEYLMGAYNANEEADMGVYWYEWRGDHYSLKYSHMAIR